MPATNAPSALKAGPLQIRDWGGPGANVLLLHGMAANTHWWDDVVPLWNGRLRAAALDFRGHGDSERTPDGAYTTDLWVDDVETARRALGWDRFILCGHSMGARIALTFAQRHPERLRAVAAVDFLPEVRADRPSRFKRASGRPQPVYNSEDDILSRFRLEPGGTSMTAEKIRALGREGVRREGDGWTWKFDWRCLSIPIPPVWPQLPEIRVPSLMVRGSLSAIIGPEDFERVTRETAGSRGVTIEGAQHHVPLDKPAELAAAVAEFAASLPG
jgi:pimeloyl-ACP methyl ester carboxylesterase